MNEKGNLILILILAFIVVAMIPPIVMLYFPPADILMRLILVFLIYSTVRGYLGNSILALILTAVLVYILVIKYGYLTAAIYVFFYVLLAFQFTSVIIWGLGTRLRQG